MFKQQVRKGNSRQQTLDCKRNYLHVQVVVIHEDCDKYCQ